MGLLKMFKVVSMLTTSTGCKMAMPVGPRRRSLLVAVSGGLGEAGMEEY